MMRPLLAGLILVAASSAMTHAFEPQAFLEKHCYACHHADDAKGNLDLTTLKVDLASADNFARWVKVYDRIHAGEMPPKGRPRPDANDMRKLLDTARSALVAAEKTRLDLRNRTTIRRLTRVEYENTIRDLFDMPGIALQGFLPPDGSAHGFDKVSEALDVSHVNLAKYIEAADHVLNLAIATRPTPPKVQKRRISLVNQGGFVAHVVMNGDGVLLKNKQPDPDFPPAGEYSHLNEGAHEVMGSFTNGASVGLFRHEDESLSPYFAEHVTIYPGLYRVRTSLWSFTWDKGKVLPGRGTEAARLSVVQLTGDGRGGQHPSYVLGYYDAPSLTEKEHEVTTWLNHNEIIGFNTASLAPTANYARKGRAMAFTGPGITVDWLDIEGPLHTTWPPVAHQRLFGSLPLVEHKGTNPPKRLNVRQIGAGKNRPDPVAGIWTVHSDKPLEDANRLLAAFLPRAFRRPVSDEVRQAYVDRVAERLKAGDTFEMAMRWAYRAALCSPDFLFHVEPEGKLDDDALACRLSYMLWCSMPDDALTQLARAGKLRDERVLAEQVERMLRDPRSSRFIEDFLGQWLKLRQIAANDPDRKLYPEFSPYLQDSMVAETRAYFRELIDQNLSATYLVKSDFAMLNQKLADHYDVPGVVGSQVRRVQLPAGSPRGGLLTQGSILKITANGTTTSPVPRGAFVMARILGQPPEPPPANVPAVEPDVRGAVTIREQLDKHRNNAACASCHAHIDPPGFALESFDVLGSYRERYRSIGMGDPAPRGKIDPFIGIGFRLGPKVDPSGQLIDGSRFATTREYLDLLAANPRPLLQNLAQQLAVYATGRGLAFSDRPAMNDIVSRTEKQGGGVRTLLHELVRSPYFGAR